MVECVMELRNKLKSQNPLIIVNIVRETYDFLSTEFMDIFPFREYFMVVIVVVVVLIVQINQFAVNLQIFF